MMPHLFFLAGESSGDVIGAEAMAALAQKMTFRSSGVGGPLMQEQGLASAFDMEALSLIGITQVLPKLPKLWRLMDGLIDQIIASPPDMIVTIDAPDFSLRLQKRVRKLITQGKLPHIHQVHIVAPTVWAWRSGRAAQIAGYLDKLFCLFDFEPPYFERAGLAAEFVGHPASQHGLAGYDAAAARKSFGFSKDQPILCLAPGSRASEIKALMPTYAQTISLLHEQIPNLGLVATVTPQHMQCVIDGCRGLPIKVQMTFGNGEQPRTLAAATAALVTSGTMTLRVTLSETPMVVGYKVSALTYAIGKRLIPPQQKFALPNVLATEVGEPAPVPEHIQADCTPEQLVSDLLPLLKGDPLHAKQMAQLRKISQRLSTQMPFGDALANGIATLLL